MNRNAYTPITADPVLLRLNSCRDWGTLHQRIRKAFGFPDYYGAAGGRGAASAGSVHVFRRCPRCRRAFL